MQRMILENAACCNEPKGAQRFRTRMRRQEERIERGRIAVSRFMRGS